MMCGAACHKTSPRHNRLRMRLPISLAFCHLSLALLLAQCSSTGTGAGAPAVSGRGMPQIINVSAYDPKERQREGRSYSSSDVSALRANGAAGLIARAGKGGNLDTKCANFLTSADRNGMLVGVYYSLQTHAAGVAQADQSVAR